MYGIPSKVVRYLFDKVSVGISVGLTEEFLENQNLKFKENIKHETAIRSMER